ncbi:isoleucine--tRNA ligase [Candidatus Woesearchaeota archaeon B3_Woes]|nr:MAG: isoleucine--tRNA ligase [Candidatus Woesearchaeota archaeon B3_Woes]
MANYNFKTEEEITLRYWKEHKIYDKLQKKNQKGKKFYFLQGPPYTSGRLHIAHAWNNSLKDIALRYKKMNGFNVLDRAGYDMHGLPTESKVQKELKLKYKEDIEKYGLDKFIKRCKEFSINNAKLMDKDMQRLGIWFDYENAYYPIKNEFIEGEWWLIKKAYEQKRLYKGKKIMHWCSSCETSLAKHELEYENDKDTSIFLKFKLKDKDEFLIIWTTTPWTIPFNLGVMVNPDLDYLKVEVEKEVWYVAKALAGIFINNVLNKKFKILKEFKGKKLEGLEYIHPLEDEINYKDLKAKHKNIHTVLLSKEYVDTTAGTGLVHTAPGCGPEDYEVGKEYNIPPFNTLNEKGEFEDLGKYTGFKAKDDDSKFVEEFKNKNCLITTTQVEHEYAHCWRCHNPVVFRATEQWFLKIEDLIKQMIKNNKDVKWQPNFTSTAFDRWVEALKDNSITRQRFWGAPVPIWVCESCNNTEVIGSRKDLEKKKANKIPSDLHKPWIDEVTFPCKCGNTMKRIPDVLDVWIDSGTASWNCLEYPVKDGLMKQFYPADLILEATEQVRLWFSMLSICSTIAFKNNCYKNVYVHGMILDYQGTKMSKSLGNIISPYEVIDKYGSDILRYYMCQSKAGENMNFGWEEVKQKQRNLLVLWNIQNFLINMCKENNVNPTKLKIKPKQEEKYILSKLNSTIRDVTRLFDEYKLDETIGRIEDLFLTLSRTYMQLTREKSSVGNKQEKEEVIYAIYNVLLNILKMFAVISPFITEKIYQNLKEAFKLKEESIHLTEWPKTDEKLIDSKLEQNMDMFSNLTQGILYAREKASLGLRWPVKEVVIVTKDDKVVESVKNVEELIKKQTNIKDLNVQPSLPGIKQSVTADFAQLGPDFGSLAPKIIAKLALESPETILNHIEKEKSYKLKIDGKEVGIVKEHLVIKRDVPSPYIENESKGIFIYLNKERTDELEAEGYLREVMRRVQIQRKKANLNKTDKISLFIKADEELKDILSVFEKQIKEKVGADTLKISELDPSKKHKFSSKEKVKDYKFEMFFS